MVFGLAALVTAGWLKGRINRKNFALITTVFIFSKVLAFLVTRTLAEAIHVVEYEALAYCIYNAVSPRFSRRDAFSVTLLLALIAGWSDEAVQYFAPERYYDLLDVLLNTFSGAFGVVIASILHDEGSRG